MTFMTKVQTASNVLGVLQKLESQIGLLEIEQIGMEVSDDDPWRINDEGVTTYAGRKEELRAQIQRLEAEFIDLAPLIDKLRKRQEEQELAMLPEDDAPDEADETKE